MLGHMTMRFPAGGRSPLPALLAAMVLVVPLRAQGTLDRSPNLPGGWVVGPGTIQFNFVHRFVRSPGPVRKVTNYPNFTAATSFLRGTTFGFNYASNSNLVQAYPNEWEFLARVAPLRQRSGFPVDLSVQGAYNLAADGVDAELSLARSIGPVRIIGVGRLLTDPGDGKDLTDAVVGGGGAIRLTRSLSLQGDYVSRTTLGTGEEAAWSAGLAVAIPGTPHTLSLHASNAGSGSLQGMSRGEDKTRYGFEFTIPLTLARFLGGARRATVPAAAAAAPGAVVDDAASVHTGMSNMQFLDGTLEVRAGAVVEWRNDDPLAHSVTADDLSFDSGNVASGTTWRYRFDRPGRYPFHCTPHPFMRGVIVVRE